MRSNPSERLTGFMGILNAGEAELLPIPHRRVDEPPAYGRRLLIALQNQGVARSTRRKGAPHPVNAKRVLGILRADGLTLQAHTVR
jgi:hypothetical protein